jgi:hypothetical protein
MAEAAGRNEYEMSSYNGHTTLFGSETLGQYAGQIATGVRIASWTVLIVGLAVNWAGSSYERSLDGHSDVFWGGLADATGVSDLYNGLVDGDAGEVAFGALGVLGTVTGLGKPLGVLRGLSGRAGFGWLAAGPQVGAGAAITGVGLGIAAYGSDADGSTLSVASRFLGKAGPPSRGRH